MIFAFFGVVLAIWAWHKYTIAVKVSRLREKDGVKYTSTSELNWVAVFICIILFATDYYFWNLGTDITRYYDATGAGSGLNYVRTDCVSYLNGTCNSTIQVNNFYLAKNDTRVGEYIAYRTLDGSAMGLLYPFLLFLIPLFIIYMLKDAMETAFPYLFPRSGGGTR